MQRLKQFLERTFEAAVQSGDLVVTGERNVQSNGCFEVTLNGEKKLHSKLSGQGHVSDSQAQKIAEAVAAAL